MWTWTKADISRLMAVEMRHVTSIVGTTRREERERETE
jgi:hypothetical protein